MEKNSKKMEIKWKKKSMKITVQGKNTVTALLIILERVNISCKL